MVGGLGIGLVWGWVSGAHVRWPLRPIRAGLAVGASTLLLAAWVGLMSGGRSTTAFLTACGLSVFLSLLLDIDLRSRLRRDVPSTGLLPMGFTSIVLLSAVLSVAQGPGASGQGQGTQTPPVVRAADPPASTLQALGAGGFGFLIGWYVYYVNRYRKDDVKLGDLTTLIGIVGGGAVLGLFPARSDLFGAYGIGLALGFFGYFLLLVILVARSTNFDADWFLDGRRRDPGPNVSIPGGTAVTTHAMAPQFASAPQYSHITIQPGSQVTIQGSQSVPETAEVGGGTS